MTTDKTNRLKSFKISLVIKLVLGISISTALVYFLVFRYINFDFEQIAVAESRAYAKTVAYNSGSQVQAELNHIVIEMRSLSHAFTSYLKIPDGKARPFFNAILNRIVVENSRYASVWDTWENRFIDSTYTKDHGRISTSYYRDGNFIRKTQDSLNFEGDDPASMYYGVKIRKNDFITEPYFYMLGNKQVLMSSIGSSMIINDEFAGMVGVDISLEEFSRMVDTIKPFPGSSAFIVSAEMSIIAHPNRNYIGKKYDDIDSINSSLYAIGDRLKREELVDFEHVDQKQRIRMYTIFLPFEVANTDTKWALAINVPLNSIVSRVETQMADTKEVGYYGFAFLMLITIIISVTIILPLNKTTVIIEELACGNIQSIKTINIRTGDEIAEMSSSVNTVIKGLKQTVAFADKIKSGDFNYSFQPLSTNDTLGNSLLDMRDSLVRANQERERRKLEESQKNWSSQGLNIFAVLLRQNNDDLHKLSQQIIIELVDYVDVQYGAVYLVNQSDDERFLELYASCGFIADRIEQTEVYAGDGVVGRCLVEKSRIYIDDVPKEYSKISSGLGKSIPKSILVIPLIVNEEIIGVIEVGSLKTMEEYKINFIETVGIPIGSTISMVRINVRTAKLLEESKIQADELAQQEEEMRQNMEEMTATQEESTNREDQQMKFIHSVTSAIFYVEYDLSGNIIEINDRLLKLFQLTREQAVGKKMGTYEFNSQEKTQEIKEFWNRLTAGEVIEQEFYAKYLGQEFWLNEVYTPIRDHNGNPFKVVNVATDISEEKRKERQIKSLKEKLEMIKKVYNSKKRSEKKEGPKLIDISEIIKDDTQFKYIRLSHLAKVYKGDLGKIQNILKIYREAIPFQIEEMRQLLLVKDWEQLKARIIGFRTKMTYLGVDKLQTLARQVEKYAAMQDSENHVMELIDNISEIWEEAEKELQTIELT
ncbi:MAG: PAS domain S-box protein [Salinivirgaceae bacterium]|nr:PAS domain S-box protein [Salinivirgaceae bacterium]